MGYMKASRAGSPTSRFDKFFTMGNPPDYEPGPEKSVAQRTGKTPDEVAYDYIIAEDQYLYFPVVNHVVGDHEPIREMLSDPPSRRSLRRDEFRAVNPIYDSCTALSLGTARGCRFHPHVDEAAERFGTRRLVGLTCGPGVGCRDHFYRKAQGDMRVLSRSRTPASFLWDVFS